MLTQANQTSFKKGMTPWNKGKGGYSIKEPTPHLSKTGYFRVYIAGKRILYHRYIMEQHLGRTLTRKEVIHHIDGDRLNNDIQNLKIITQSEHIRQYDAGRKTSHDWGNYIVPKVYGKKCSICNKPHKCKGLCTTHFSCWYQWHQRHC